MKPLQFGSTGDAVQRLQMFLIGRHLLGQRESDGYFGSNTEAAVRKYQAARQLRADGIVGNVTFAAMMADGFAFFPPAAAPGQFPPKPNFPPLVSNSERARVFGKFDTVPAPTRDNPEAVQICGDWEEKNIDLFVCPQLVTAQVSQTGKVRMHRLVRQSFLELWADWERAGLLSLVLSWEGGFLARYVRGSRTVLSNHAFGSAFDINYAWNKLGHVPAAKGTRGSVRELVPIAHEHGWYWGGHFSRADGMHFEKAVV